MKNRVSRGLPQIDFTPYDLQVLKSAIGLFSETLAQNNKPVSNAGVAARSLDTLQRKIDALENDHGKTVKIDFNEAIIIVGALNMYCTDTVLFSPDRATPEMLKTCQGMIAYFTAIQEQRQVD